MNIGGLKKDQLLCSPVRVSLLWAGVLGDSLGALRDGVLGELSREKEPDSSLDLARGDGATLVVVSESWGLSTDALKDVIHERVHDRHSLWGDASVGVDLLEHLVDVDGVRFLPPALALLVAGTHGLSLAGLLGSFGWNFGWHDGRSTELWRATARPFLLYHRRRNLGEVGARSERSKTKTEIQRFHWSSLQNFRRKVTARPMKLLGFRLRFTSSKFRSSFA